MRAWPPWAREHDLTAVERAGQVDLEEAVPILGGDVEELVEALDPGVVDEHGGASEAGTDLVRGALDCGPVGDIDGQTHGPTARRSDLGRRRLGRLAVPIEDGHRQPVTGQSSADGQPDAGSATGDDGRSLAVARPLLAAHGHPTLPHNRLRRLGWPPAETYFSEGRANRNIRRT
jgi:hypothetical protein